MEEFGARIAHSDMPTVAMIPFFHIFTQMSYSVMWPLHNLQYGGTCLCLLTRSNPLSNSPDDLTRDRVPSSRVRPGLERACHALPWSPSSLPLSDSRWSQLTDLPAQQPAPEYQEDLPSVLPDISSTLSFPLKVFTDMGIVQRHLKHPKFMLVSTEEEADIIWMHDHFKAFK